MERPPSFESIEQRIPWSLSALRRLGNAIRDDSAAPVSAPPYDHVLLWHSELAATIQEQLVGRLWASWSSHAWESASRAKTIDTLRDKLQRDPATPLPSIQDLAGVRFEADMTLTEQDAVADFIVATFGEERSTVRDLRSEPHSGYRAVHVWLRLPAGRVEVQVRTHLQGRWANAYEELADVLGHEIRYSVMPADPDEASVVRAVQRLSVEDLADLERDLDHVSSLPGATVRPEDLHARRQAYADDLDRWESRFRTWGREED